MRVLVNTTTLHSGGGLQVGVSFISHAMSDPSGIDWRFAISEYMAEELYACEIDLPKDTLQIESPTRSRQARKQLAAFSNLIQADVVYTVFGPAYVRFPMPHVCGVADGWTTHPTKLAYQSLPSFGSKLSKAVQYLYKGYWFKAADRWIVEASCAKQGLQDRFQLSNDAISVISNTCSQGYRQAAENREIPSHDAPIRLLTFAYPYPHKNIEIIPEVAARLKEAMPERQFEFIVSIPESDPTWKKLIVKIKRFGVQQSIRNVGRVSIANGPTLYREADIVFMPTLLETFSASYPEAMAMGLPIITTDLDFAHDICGEAALYYQPCCPESAAEQIAQLVNSPSKWHELTSTGKQQLARLPDSRERYVQTVKILQDLANPTLESSVRHAA